MKIREIVISPAVTITPFHSTDHAIDLMTEHGVRQLLVIDREGLVGMLTEGDLLECIGMLKLQERRELGTPFSSDEVIVADVMEAEVPCTSPDELVTDVVYRVVQLNRTALPVVGEGRPVGVVTEFDLMRAFTGSCWSDRGTPHTEPVINYSSRVLKTISPMERLDAACRKLNGGKVRHLPVMDGDQFVGLIGEPDIRRAIGKSDVGQWLSWPIAEVMRTGLELLTSKTTLSQAAEKMQRLNVTALPIVDKHGKLISLLTSSDLLQAFSGCNTTVNI